MAPQAGIAAFCAPPPEVRERRSGLRHHGGREAPEPAPLLPAHGDRPLQTPEDEREGDARTHSRFNRRRGEAGSVRELYPHPRQGCQELARLQRCCRQPSSEDPKHSGHAHPQGREGPHPRGAEADIHGLHLPKPGYVRPDGALRGPPRGARELPGEGRSPGGGPP